jgi:ribosomal protein L37AE/L43A
MRARAQILDDRARVHLIARKRKGNEAMTEQHFCHLCWGPLQVLGVLAQTIWYRCRECGMESFESLDPCELKVSERE